MKKEIDYSIDDIINPKEKEMRKLYLILRSEIRCKTILLLYKLFKNDKDTIITNYTIAKLLERNYNQVSKIMDELVWRYELLKKEGTKINFYKMVSSKRMEEIIKKIIKERPEFIGKEETI